MASLNGQALESELIRNGQRPKQPAIGRLISTEIYSPDRVGFVGTFATSQPSAL